ncbi:MGH1-like glycoside hydrolase domain-containing protein [Thioflavicoccus mobilis]|uniref:MGH1-like glycoside hydrolase domain-containing protein n=1 Tax=Thioflavicoccus mobilis TaxID=80679 RepID=UPI000302BF37|nr:trehalase family glycosidase [Thioflavicoccus mobilis]
MQRLRQVLGRLRQRTDRATAFVGRYYRALRYVWSLIVWSRISAGRAGLLPIELPSEVLAHKGIDCAPPRLTVSGGDGAEQLGRGFAEVYATLFANLQPADLLSQYRHAIPGPAFRGVYLWDSAFIAQVWKWWDRQVAQEVLLAVLELRDGDRLQHVVTELFQSRFTQPPLLAWSALAVADTLEPKAADALLRQVYGPLAAYQAWLDDQRRLENGLYFWAHPYESGVENAPRFSNADESRLRNTTRLGAPDLTTYVILQREALATMARRLGRRGEAQRHTAAARSLRERLNRLAWSERDGLYYDVDGAGMHVRVATIASLLPLWAGVPDPVQARRMLTRIMDSAHFATLIPLPSVDRAEHAFEKDMWRGPVWVNTAYGILLGLLRYGFEREAGELAHRLCLGVYRVFAAERQIYEFYDPDAWHTRDLRRKRGNWWKTLTLGRGPQRDFVGWSGLVNNLILEVLLGLVPGRESLSICPRLPPACIGTTYRLDLPAPGGRLELSVTAADRFEGTWRDARGTVSFSTRFAERVHLATAGRSTGEPRCVSATSPSPTPSAAEASAPTSTTSGASSPSAPTTSTC